MTGKELLQYEIEQVGKQIDACLDGMSDAAFHSPCAPNGMTPCQILEHLSEAYVAFAAVSKGEKHSWGSFSVHDKSKENLEKVFRECRDAASKAALAGEDDETQKHAYDYIIGHDNYHVGQLVLGRMSVELSWNGEAIYA
ncbi:MAG TPA: hypothetical protein VHE55_17970 [Fimbriimonadaceae bacterium]|nr:hypothetical protein [Fimbriimonadaceae bacterium]